MKDFATIDNTTGAFPDVESENVTSPGADDGTPAVKQWVDEMWGFFQAVLNASEQTPSGSTETASASQLLQGLRNLLGTPGEIVAWAGKKDVDPTTLFPPIRLLELKGQGVQWDATKYTNLDNNVYVGDAYNATAAAFYHADNPDGTSRNTTGVYLILPDFRGYILRGYDEAANIDPNGASRTIGDAQGGGVQWHQHQDLREAVTGVEYAGRNFWDLPITGTIMYRLATKSGVENDIRTSEVVQSSNPSEPSIPVKSNIYETRMDNAAIRWMIRY
jgi:hypothetical protein